jgi:FAD-linked oxidoreductase
MSRAWKNWAGNETARVLSIEKPKTEDALASLVKQSASQGERVKVVGSGHSFTPAAVTDGRLVDIRALSGLLAVDKKNGTVTVGAGTTLNTLNQLLHAEGLSMANLGDIAYQSVAGAISTSTHGTGHALPGLAAQVVGMRIIDGGGNVVVCDAEQNSDVLEMARVSVGALGAITECTLKVVDAFRLQAHEVPMRLNDVLDNIDELSLSNDHFEFFWIPHTKWALTKRNNRTDEPIQPLPKIRGWVEKTFMENVAFGALCHVGRLRPSLIPRLATALPSSGSRTYVEQSYKIFASPRFVHFYEMEHALPRESLAPALREICAMIERKGYMLNFPVEVRVTAPDDVPLSTSYGRESAYIAVHVFRGMEFTPFFKDVEQILRGYDARPHWGKVHHRDAAELAGLYPRFNDFLAMRDRLDSERTFANRYTERVFGS